ncbi:MAG: peptidoglycan-binding domain-containing protein [Kibdelosporangium sp.]
MTGRQPTGRRRTVVRITIAAGVVATVTAIAVGVTGWLRPAPAGPALPAAAGATAKVTRMTLAETAVAGGELGYGQAEPIESKAAGTVTWLPEIGAVLARGDVLLRADEKPVVLLYGQLPLYRPLALDTTGPDVLQFETNLRALGYTGFAVDDKFSDTTVTAVKRWQRKLKQPETGTVDANLVAFAPGAIRVAARSVRIGAAAGAQILTYTANTKVVTVNAPARNTSWAVPGTKVSVVLPGATPIEGTVSAVGTEATAPPSQGESSQDNVANAVVPITIAVADQAALGALQRSPVEVRYITRQQPDVLTAPVAALLAPIEGGYALEVVEGTGTRIIAVQTGLFADGRVEVRGAGVTDGMTVRVPA